MGDMHFSGFQYLERVERACGHAVESLPGISSAQILASRAKVCFDETTFITFHRRGDLDPFKRHLVHVLQDARNAIVKLTLEDTVLALEVRDNGVGLENATAESRRHGSGLRNLRERAQMTGGQFNITRAPGRGTLAQLSWRLQHEEPILVQVSRKD